MSRLYGRIYDLYETSKYLNENVKRTYHDDKTPTSWESVEECIEKVKLYIPKEAIKKLAANPVQIVKRPLSIQKSAYLPTSNKPEPKIFFTTNKAIEEYKRDIIFFVGQNLSTQSPDEMPKQNDIPCEYSYVVELLLEYLYLKEEQKEDVFSIKHLEELKSPAKNYIKAYEYYQKKNETIKQIDAMLLTDSVTYIKDNEKSKGKFLKALLKYLIPMSSMDATLQIIDKDLSKDEMKVLLNQLIINENHNRQQILQDIGIDSFGFKRLRKEIDKKNCKK